jgi:ABC-2 type transport system ATP-binding protein
MIEVSGFGKSYGGELAVDEVSLRVAGGDVLGLVGPNGAGKTTTLRALAGIIPPSSGRLGVDGFDVQRQPREVKARTAYVADDPQLFTELTVDEHLAFTAGVYQLASWERDAALLLERFELSHKRRAVAGDLSRGMRQKLAICCALLHGPTALLLDEPMTGLDPHAIRMLKRTIAERAAAGVAVIVSSHLLAVIEEVCSHVAILDRGRRRFFGPIDELRASAASDDTLEEIFFRTVAPGAAP